MSRSLKHPVPMRPTLYFIFASICLSSHATAETVLIDKQLNNGGFERAPDGQQRTDKDGDHIPRFWSLAPQHIGSVTQPKVISVKANGRTQPGYSAVLGHGGVTTPLSKGLIG